MTERRETRRPRRRRDANPASPRPPAGDPERIAKYLARCGVASRRAAEDLIAEGLVTVDGRRLDSPAVKVTGGEEIRVRGKRVRPPEPARLWRYHKPSGLISTNSDPDGRRTIFDELPKSLPRTITVGRLDLTTEGLLLLTNDGALARALELPSTALVRRYRARAFGKADQAALDTLADGVEVDGVRFGPIQARLERETGSNSWISVELAEGRKREVRQALESVGLKVNRLIRTDYGPFTLGDLKPGVEEEVPARTLLAEIGPLIPAQRLPSVGGAAASAIEQTPRSGKPKGSDRAPPKRRRRT